MTPAEMTAAWLVLLEATRAEQRAWIADLSAKGVKGLA